MTPNVLTVTRCHYIRQTKLNKPIRICSNHAETVSISYFTDIHIECNVGSIVRSHANELYREVDLLTDLE